LLAGQREANGRFLTRLLMFAQANLPALHFTLKAFDLQVIQTVLTWFRGPAGGATLLPAAAHRAMGAGRVLDLPDRLQGRGLQVSDVGWSNAVLVLSASLEAMKAENPGVPALVVYIPSPLSSYELVSESASRPGEPDQATLVAERGLRMRRDVCE